MTLQIDAGNSIDITLRPLRRGDFPLLVGWINAPHVARWWDGAADIESVTEKYSPRLKPDSATSVFVIEIDERPVGIVQCYRHADNPEWNRAVGIDGAAGIDYMIGDVDCTGKGIGTRAIQAITEVALSRYPEVESVVSVPQKNNRASWRALEKAGFRRIDERKLESDCPSDSGVSYIYRLKRDKHV